MLRSTSTSIRSLTRSFTPTIRSLPFTTRLIQSKATSTPLPNTSTRSIALDALGIFASFAALTFAFSAVGSSKAVRLDGARTGFNSEDGEVPSEFLFARGGREKDPKEPVFTREEATVVIVIGSPKAGKTTNALRISNMFDAMYEAADSDIYSDIALNRPTAHLSNPHGSSKLRIVVDDFTTSTDDPLAKALQFEADIAPILLFIFVDCPLKDAELRVPEGERAALKKEYEEWEKKIQPLIKHYRHKGNFLEITGQWPADEQWEQVEAKLESAYELEARGDL